MTFFNTVFVTFVNALSITLIISSHTITQSSIIIFCTHDTFYVPILSPRKFVTWALNSVRVLTNPHLLWKFFRCNTAIVKTRQHFWFQCLISSVSKPTLFWLVSHHTNGLIRHSRHSTSLITWLPQSLQRQTPISG